MRAAAALGVALLGVAGASRPSRNIREVVDPYNNMRRLYLEVSTQRCPDDPQAGAHDWDVHVLFSAMEMPDHGTVYLLTPELDYGDALSLRKNGTMDVLVDDKPGQLVSTVGSTITTGHAYNRSFIHETVPFQVRREELEVLSRAHRFQFRVNGPRQAVQRCTDEKRMRDLAEFLTAAADYDRGP